MSEPTTEKVDVVGIVNDIYRDEDDDEIHSSSVSCDTIRKKITMFLASKEMTQTAFLVACGGVNNNSYGRFMKLKGSHSGRDNGMYWGAVNFFHRRDKAAKEAKKLEKASSKKRPAAASAEGSAKVAKVGSDGCGTIFGDSGAKAAIAEVKLPEVDLPESAPVFDDCDEVRTKIAQCIQGPGMSQAKFAREIYLTPGN